MAAIVAADILYRYSIGTGSAGNAAASTAAGSLGKYLATNGWSGAANDLFDDISGAENSGSIDDYRCFFVYNSNAANALQNAVVWFTEADALGAQCSIAVDSIVASAGTASAAQSFGPLTNETTVGALLSNIVTGAFSTAAITQGAGLSLGNIPALGCRAVWVKRHAQNNAAKSGDGITIYVAGDTGAA
jgi:hypothetical protein